MTDIDQRSAAERVMTTTLTIHATAKYPGTVGPDDATPYVAALTEAHEAFGGQVGEIPAMGHLLAVSFDLAEFAASRGPETTIELVQAFARHLLERGAES